METAHSFPTGRLELEPIGDDRTLLHREWRRAYASASTGQPTSRRPILGVSTNRMAFAGTVLSMAKEVPMKVKSKVKAGVTWLH